jgi:hypothetical protein
MKNGESYKLLAVRSLPVFAILRFGGGWPGFALPIFQHPRDHAHCMIQEIDEYQNVVAGFRTLDSVDVTLIKISNGPTAYVGEPQVYTFVTEDSNVHSGTLMELEHVLRSFVKRCPDQVAVALQIAELIGNSEQKRAAIRRMCDCIYENGGAESAIFFEKSVRRAMLWDKLIAGATNANAAARILRKRTKLEPIIHSDGNIKIDLSAISHEDYKRTTKFRLDAELSSELNSHYYCNNIVNVEFFENEIAKNICYELSVIRILDDILHKPQFLKSSFAPPNGSTELGARARCLAGRLVRAEFDDALRVLRMAFDDALRVLRMAIESCSLDSEEKERKVLFDILCWLLPASYDLKHSELVLWAHKKGNVFLLESYAATAIAAELRMAAIGHRSAEFIKNSDIYSEPVASNRVPFAPTHGLGSDEQEELLYSVDSYLFEKYGSNDFPGPPDNYRQEINELLRVAFEDGLGTPYLLFGGASDESGLKPEELEALARRIKERYPALVVLRLSDDVALSRQEFNQLSSLLQILKKA